MRTLFNIIRNWLIRWHILSPETTEIQRHPVAQAAQMSVRQIGRYTGRAATEADLADIVALEQVCYNGYLAWDLQDFTLDFRTNPYAVYWVIEWHHHIIGVMIGRFLYRDAHISHLFVHPDYRKQGIASALVAWWMQYVRELGIQKTSLEVRESNITAQQLYQRAGFQVVKRIPDYYRSQSEAALYMEYWSE